MNKINISIHTDSHTSIGQCLAENKRHLISKLSVIGYYISDFDNKIIRKMCNSLDENGTYTVGCLEELDLTKAEIFGSRNCNQGYIGCQAFKGCQTLRTIKFGKSLSSVMGYDFSDCSSLEEINVAADNNHYYSKNGVLYSILDSSCMPHRRLPEGEWVLVKVPSKIKDSRKIDLNKIKSIEDSAFENTSLTELEMPNIAPICGPGAFKGVDLSTIRLIVPKGALNNYWCHPVWGNFQIEEKQI